VKHWSNQPDRFTDKRFGQQGVGCMWGGSDTMITCVAAEHFGKL